MKVCARRAREHQGPNGRRGGPPPTPTPLPFPLSVSVSRDWESHAASRKKERKERRIALTHSLIRSLPRSRPPFHSIPCLRICAAVALQQRCHGPLLACTTAAATGAETDSQEPPSPSLTLRNGHSGAGAGGRAQRQRPSSGSDNAV